MIPLGNQYTSTASGSVVKSVQCEHCQTEYVYVMQRTAEGSDFSVLFTDNKGASERATEFATNRLQEKLAEGFDAVPCHSCFRYQSYMVPKIRQKYRRWMIHVGVGLLIGVIPMGLIGGMANFIGEQEPDIPVPVFFGGLGFMVLLGLGLIIARAVVVKKYDPDTQPEAYRQRVAHERTITKADFERIIEAQKTPPKLEPKKEKERQPKTANEQWTKRHPPKK